MSSLNIVISKYLLLIHNFAFVFSLLSSKYFFSENIHLTCNRKKYTDNYTYQIYNFRT